MDIVIHLDPRQVCWSYLYEQPARLSGAVVCSSLASDVRNSNITNDIRVKVYKPCKRVLKHEKKICSVDVGGKSE